MKTSTIAACLLSATLLVSGCKSLQPGGGAGGWSAAMESRRAALEAATRDSGIIVLQSPDNEIQINLPTDFTFDSNSAAIKPAMRPLLDQLADDLKAGALAQTIIKVVGYTDSQGDEGRNQALSLARAVAVQKHFEARGIAPTRIEAEGRGESDPEVSNAQRYGRSLNRRVELFLREPGGKP